MARTSTLNKKKDKVKKGKNKVSKDILRTIEKCVIEIWFKVKTEGDQLIINELIDIINKIKTGEM